MTGKSVRSGICVSQKSTCLLTSSLFSQICLGNLACTGTETSSTSSSSSSVSKISTVLLFLVVFFTAVVAAVAITVEAVSKAAPALAVAAAASGVAWAGVALSLLGVAWAGVVLSFRGDFLRGVTWAMAPLRGDLRVAVTCFFSGLTGVTCFLFRGDFRTGGGTGGGVAAAFLAAAFLRLTGTKLSAPSEFISDTLNHRPDFLC